MTVVSVVTSLAVAGSFWLGKTSHLPSNPLLNGVYGVCVAAVSALGIVAFVGTLSPYSSVHIYFDTMYC